MMNTPITAAERADYHTLKTYWLERIGFEPSPYQFFTWLKLWHLDALKEAVRCTARWLQRKYDKQESGTEEDLIRYFSATARNIHQAMQAAAEIDAGEDQ
jgi:hypothetical protein